MEGHHIQIERVRNIQDNKKTRLINVNGFYPIKPNLNITYGEKPVKPSSVNPSHSTSEYGNSSVKDKYYIHSSNPILSQNIPSSSKVNCLTDSIKINSSKGYKMKSSDSIIDDSLRNEDKSSHNLSDNIGCLKDDFNVRTQLFIKSPTNSSYVYHKKNRNFYNSDILEPNTRIDSQVRHYDTDIGESEPVIKSSNTTMPYIHSADRNKSHLMVSSNENESESYSFHVLPLHFKDMKNLNSSNKLYNTSINTNSCTDSLKNELDIETQISSDPESLNRKKLELQAKAEQLRITEEIVKKREEEAQAKTWQALQQQEALLLEKERNLKYREIFAQKKYDEAMKMLEESKTIADEARSSFNSNKDSDNVNIRNSLSTDKYPNHRIQLYNAGNLLNSRNEFDSSNMKSINLQSDKEEYEQRENTKDALPYISFKPSLKVCDKKQKEKKKYSALEVYEVKPIIEPSKILHTYSRKSTKRQNIDSKFRSDEPFIHYCEMQSNNDIDILDDRNFKEHILVNESGTVTITQLPKFDQPVRSQSALPHLHSLSGKRKSDDNCSLPSFPRPLKKCPSRIEMDSSTNSSSSDLSISFTEKVEKLTSDFQYYNRALGKREHTEKQLNCISRQTNEISEKCLGNYQCANKKSFDACPYKQNVKNEDKSKINVREKLSIVTLEGISYPGKSSESSLGKEEAFIPLKFNKNEVGKRVPIESDDNIVKVFEPFCEERLEISKNESNFQEEENDLCNNNSNDNNTISNTDKQKPEFNSTENNVLFYELSNEGKKVTVKDVLEGSPEYTHHISDPSLSDSKNQVVKKIMRSQSSDTDLNIPPLSTDKREKVGNKNAYFRILDPISSSSPLDQNESNPKSKLHIEGRICISSQNEGISYCEKGDSLSDSKERENEEYLEEFNCLQNLSYSSNDYLNSEYILNKELMSYNCEQNNSKNISLLNSYSEPNITNQFEPDATQNLRSDSCAPTAEPIQRSNLMRYSLKDTSSPTMQNSDNLNDKSVTCENSRRDMELKTVLQKSDTQLESISLELKDNHSLEQQKYSNSESTKSLLTIKTEKDTLTSFKSNSLILTDIGTSNVGVHYASSIIYTSPSQESTHIYTANTPSCSTLDVKGNIITPVNELNDFTREEAEHIYMADSSSHSVDVKSIVIASSEINDVPIEENAFSNKITSDETGNLSSTGNSFKNGENLFDCNLRSASDHINDDIQKTLLYKGELRTCTLNESDTEKNERSRDVKNSLFNHSCEKSKEISIKISNDSVDSVPPDCIPHLYNSGDLENVDEANDSVLETSTDKNCKEIQDSPLDSCLNRSSSLESFACDTEMNDSSDKISNVTSKRGRLIKLKDWWPEMVAEPQKKTRESENSLISNKVQKCSPETNLMKPKGKRGRKRKRKSVKCDEQTENENAGSCIWIKHIFPALPNTDSSFQCGKCENTFESLPEFRDHAFLNHSGLVRVKGECQDFDEDVSQEIIKFVFKIHKKLICDVCGNSFRSILGFNYHRQRCGKVLRVKNGERKKKKKLLVGDELSEILNNKREKRKAAKTCYSHMKLLYDNIDSVDDASKDRDFENKINSTNFTPKSFFDYSSLKYETFMDNLKKDGVSKCINSKCEYLFYNLEKLKQHLNTCSYSEYFICKICNTTLKECDANIHMEENHHDYSSDSSDDSSSYCKTEYRIFRVFLDSKKMTTEFRDNNYSSCLYPEFRCNPSDWIELSESEASMYHSNLKHSPMFKFRQNHDNIESRWGRVDYLAGQNLGLGSIIFTGGPISCSAWCPLPDGKKLLSQYIALSSLANPDQCLPVNESLQRKGLIQIWNCGTLDESQIPSMAMCIAHDFGVSWSLDWCPSGIYEEKSDGDEVNRLGMLASAFSDGSIRIYVIPHPDQIKSKNKVFKKKPDISLYYSNHKTTKSQCVKVNWCQSKSHSLIAGSFTNGMVCIWNLNTCTSFLKSNDGEHEILLPVNSIHAHNGVCSTVSFCSQTQGQHIVTGGIDKAIKYWDLTQPDHPLSVIRKGIVTDSTWLPHWAGSFFSFDDAFSLGKTSSVFRENGFFGGSQRTVVGSNASVWCIASSDWYNAVAQMDEAGEVMVSCQRNLICENLNEKSINKKRFPIFSVRLENLQDGTVLNLKEEYECKEARPNEQGNGEKCSEGDLDQSNAQTSHLLNKSFKDLPLTYESCSEIYGIKISDENYSNFTKEARKALQSKQYAENMEPGPLTIYPLMGGSSVSWNNNYGTHSWIFVGMKSGLGRIIRLSFLE